MRRIVAALDDVAERLETQGAIEEAKQIDVISNTIEAGIRESINRMLYKVMRKLGIKELPTPVDAAKALAGVSVATLDKLGEAIFGGPIYPGPPLAIARSAATDVFRTEPFWAGPREPEGIPSELERLTPSEKELIPPFMSIIKEMGGGRREFLPVKF